MDFGQTTETTTPTKPLPPVPPIAGAAGLAPAPAAQAGPPARGERAPRGKPGWFRRKAAGIALGAVVGGAITHAWMKRKKK